MKEDIDVTSPTYTIIQTYQPHKGPEIWHMDFYRLNNSVDINDLDLDEEIKNLTIFKKGLFNSDFAEENELLNILNPVIKSESVWKPHALYLMAEYYFSKKEKQKSKEFFIQIISLENVNPKIKLEAQKRLRADFSE